MSPLAFCAALPLLGFTPRAPAVAPRRAPRAGLQLIPGVPPGEDSRDGAPLQYYVPRPKEDYSNRSFATPLPVTWAGEVGTIGVADIDQTQTEESIAEARLVPEDEESKGALGAYATMMSDERSRALAKFDVKQEVPGRATCGESEGKTVVSNCPELVTGTGWGEYWPRK
jgi:hypothetical protein